MIKPRETFHFEPSIQIKGEWMLGLKSLEVYNFNFNITEENNKIETYKFPDSKNGGNLYEKVRDEIEKDLDISDFTTSDLEDDIIAQISIEEDREQVKKKERKMVDILTFYRLSVDLCFKFSKVISEQKLI